MPAATTPDPGSARMSARFSFSSTKNGPSVSAAVRTQVGLPAGRAELVLPVRAVVVVSAELFPPDAQATRTDCDTTTLAAPFAASPSKSRRLSCVRGRVSRLGCFDIIATPGAKLSRRQTPPLLLRLPNEVEIDLETNRVRDTEQDGYAWLIHLNVVEGERCRSGPGDPPILELRRTLPGGRSRHTADGQVSCHLEWPSARRRK